MSTQVAYHARGRRMHSSPDCCRNLHPATIDGGSFTDGCGHSDTWHPCSTCGTPLLRGFITGRNAPRRLWLASTHRVTDQTTSWQIRKRRSGADLLTGAVAAGDITVLDDTLPDADELHEHAHDVLDQASAGDLVGAEQAIGRFRAAVWLPDDAAQMIVGHLWMWPLPNDAGTLLAGDPVTFTQAADVFAKLLRAEPAPWDHQIDNTTVDDSAAWAGARWTAAVGVASPADH